jgi:hypothetical protein
MVIGRIEAAKLAALVWLDVVRRVETVPLAD